MFKELFTEGRKGPGGPQGNFNLAPTVSSGSDEYWDAMANYNNKTMQDLATIAKKFKAEGRPETMNVAGVAGDGYQLLLYTGKGKGFNNTIKIKYYSPRDPWSIVVEWDDNGRYAYSSSSEKIGSGLEIAKVENALQRLADKMPGFEDGTEGSVGRYNKKKHFPCKWPRVFAKRIPKGFTESDNFLDALIFENLDAIPDANKNGDCYQLSYDYFNRTSSSAKLVHGLVTGQGALEGIRYNHSWVEEGNKVIDMTLPKQFQKSLSISMYYQIGKIKTVYKYNRKDVIDKSLEYGTYGPWNSVLLRHKY